MNDCLVHINKWTCEGVEVYKRLSELEMMKNILGIRVLFCTKADMLVSLYLLFLARDF